MAVEVAAQDPPKEHSARPQTHPPSAHQQQRFEAVKRLLAQGLPGAQVAREVGVARGTVRKYAQWERHPGTAARSPRPRRLAPYEDWLTLR
ncbi:helix-turn-helix domain-containing protein [Deinococcus planocerae]|uniref:helix-turn-helix domain-containing protein n=1 Tax=Deinococcus planocerae TaxID=1737569 RepID=UPI003CCB9A75